MFLLDSETTEKSEKIVDVTRGKNKNGKMNT